jgi:hypothetical protein
MHGFCNQSGRAVIEQISPALPARAAASVIFQNAERFSAASRRTISTERFRKKGPRRCAKNGLD